MTLPMAQPLYDPTNAGNRPGEGPLRVGGQPAQVPLEERDLPSTRAPASRRQMAALEIVRDLWAGNQALKAKGPAYLPMGPGEEPGNYAIRLLRAVLYNAFRNTIEGLTGYLFRTDPKLGDDVPAVIRTHWENLDNAGTHGDVFIRELAADAMVAGHAAILVDFPNTGGLQTAGAEQRGEARPYWVPVRKEHILSWRTTVEHGRTRLTQLVLHECTEEPVGDYGVAERKRYRVFRRDDAGHVTWELLEVTDRRTVLLIASGSYPTQTEIPVAEVVTSGRRGLFESDPPFLDLAYLNLAHYRQWSDYDTSIHKTCVPIYWEAGVDVAQAPADGTPAPPLVLGPNAARRSTNPAFKIGYASHDGAALSACKAALDDLKNDMAQLGLAALQSSKRAAETATAKELDKGASDSALAVNARGLQDGVERALQFHARYLRLEDGGSVAINRDYGTQGMDAAKMGAWATLAEKLGVPPRFVLERLMEAGEIPEGTDLDALEMEMLAQQAAQAAERQAALEAQRLQLQAGGGQAPPAREEEEEADALPTDGGP
jgi:hypothetical protein